MASENRKMKKGRDSELLKIQILADYFLAGFNFRASIVAGFFIGFLVLDGTLLFQKIISDLFFYLFMVAVTVAFLVYSKMLFRKHHSKLETIDSLFMQVEKEEALQAIAELAKLRLKSTKTKEGGHLMNDKNNSGKWDKRLFALAVLGLVVAIITPSYGFILTHEANVIAQKNLELQNMLSNYTSIVVANPEQGHLDEDGYYSNMTPSSTVPKGWLNGTITVITPHVGNLTVEIMNFSVSDYFDMLDPEKTNLTTVSYTNEYKYSKHVSYVVSGMNQLSFNLNLEATVYPSPQKLPQTSPNSSEFPIGVLFMVAKFYDAELKIYTPYEFSSIVFVTINIL